MATQTSQDPDALPQIIGEFHPVDVWQNHINQVFYALRGSHLREYYQTFATADYRLAYALAEDYYRRLCQREVQKGAATDPLTVMEWGCGNGNLAVCFLDRLKELDKENRFYPRVQYILIDQIESVVEEAKRNPELTHHGDHVTVRCADAQNLQNFRDGTIDRIICNELWNELPTKLLLTKEGDLMEEYLRPNVSEAKLAEISDWERFKEAFDRKDAQALKGFPSFLEDLVWEREYHKVETKALPFRRTVAEFLKGIDEEVLVPINVGAFETLKEAKRLLASDAIGLSSFEAGTVDYRVLNDPEKPCYALHGGQFSFMVNLALLKEVAAHLGVRTVEVEPQKEFVGRNFNANVMSLMDLLASHPRPPGEDSWETDAFILRTLHAINGSYSSPYHRSIAFPLREQTPSEEREKLEALVSSLKPNGVPDTIGYLTEEEVFGAMPDLEELGYDREGIQAAFMAPPQPVDYCHFFFSPFHS